MIVTVEAGADAADRLVDRAIASTNRLWRHVRSAMGLVPF